MENVSSYERAHCMKIIFDALPFCTKQTKKTVVVLVLVQTVFWAPDWGPCSWGAEHRRKDPDGRARPAGSRGTLWALSEWPISGGLTAELLRKESVVAEAGVLFSEPWGICRYGRPRQAVSLCPSSIGGGDSACTLDETELTASSVSYTHLTW